MSDTDKLVQEIEEYFRTECRGVPSCIAALIEKANRAERLEEALRRRWVQGYETAALAEEEVDPPVPWAVDAWLALKERVANCCGFDSPAEGHYLRRACSRCLRDRALLAKEQNHG